MTLQSLVAGSFAAVGLVALAVAVSYERRMHRHRRPGVSYAAATFRRDGGWRRAELFTDAGLALQRRASLWGVSGGLLLVAGLLAWIALGAR